MSQAQQDRHLTRDGDRGGNGSSTTDGHGSPGPVPIDSGLIDVQALLTELEGLRQRLASQPVIEQAKGILIGYYGIDDEAAFQLLRRWSQESNTKLRHIAELLTESAASQEANRPAPHQTVQEVLPSPQFGKIHQPARPNN
jgi:ANTAR domain